MVWNGCSLACAGDEVSISRIEDRRSWGHCYGYCEAIGRLTKNNPNVSLP